MQQQAFPPPTIEEAKTSNLTKTSKHRSVDTNSLDAMGDAVGD